MPGRSVQTDAYRFGFNRQEKDDEIKGSGNSLELTFRIYDPRLGKFLSVDPLTKSYPWNSSYAFAENDVIQCIDLEGLEKLRATDGKLSKGFTTLISDDGTVGMVLGYVFKLANGQDFKAWYVIGEGEMGDWDKMKPGTYHAYSSYDDASGGNCHGSTFIEGVPAPSVSSLGKQSYGAWNIQNDLSPLLKSNYHKIRLNETKIGSIGVFGRGAHSIEMIGNKNGEKMYKSNWLAGVPGDPKTWKEVQQQMESNGVMSQKYFKDLSGGTILKDEYDKLSENEQNKYFPDLVHKDEFKWYDPNPEKKK